MLFSRVVLWLTGLGFLGFGLAYTVWPLPMARLTEIPLPTSTARIDFAAMYGGLQLGFGLFLLQCARRPGRLAIGLGAAAAALSGIAAVRLTGLFLAPGPPVGVIYVGLGIELTAAALCMLAARWAAAEGAV